MTRPSTPVSGCLLKSLMITDASTTQHYESGPKDQSLTFTLEAQPTNGTRAESLILLIYRKSQQLVYTDFSETLKSSYGNADMVSVDHASLQLNVRLPREGRTVIATFIERRDFNVTICILEKSGFRITNLSPNSAPKAPMLSQASSPQRINSNFPCGPRLSAITPLTGLGLGYSPGGVGSQVSGLQFGQSFSDLHPLQSVNQPEAYSIASQSGLAQLPQPSHYPVATHPYSTTLAAPMQNFNHPQLNPYNFFLGQQGNNLHQPPVSSPLRNSLSLDGNRPQQPAAVGLYRQTSSFVDNMNQVQRASFPISLTSQPSLQPTSPTLIPGEGAAMDPQRSADNVCPVLIPNNQATISPKKAAKNFREQLPQPRSLPFISSPKKRAKPVEPRPTKKTRKSDAAVRNFQDNDKRQHQGETSGVKYKDRGTSCVQEKQTMDAGTSTRIVVFRKSGSTKAKQKPVEPAHSSQRALVKTDSSFHSQQELGLQSQLYPMIVLADPSVLRRANETTSCLFEQYQEDLQRGCDDGLCAQFYMDQILAARRSFWYTKLLNMDHSMWRTLI